ncbi:MAG: DbpA RNA binding domain-containing protein [Spirochaetales bacterium]
MEKLPVDPAAVESAIEDIVGQIHDEEDPILMTRYKRLFRKYTSLFNRGYVSAYLLKQVVEAGRAPTRRKKSTEKEKQPPTDGHQSIFVSIGRNRRVHTRDLITFFTSADGVSREDIGQIKVLDNYSFVEVSTDKAQRAIDALNGTELRGRKLTVNFARRK